MPHIAAKRVLTAILLCGSISLMLAAGAAPAAEGIPKLASAEFGWSKVADDFQAPLSGPGPVTFEKSRPYIPNNDRSVQVTVRIADLTNPILKPWAVEKMRKANEDAAAGKEAFEARASCRPGGVPGFLVMGRVNPLYFVQSPKEVLLINEGGPEAEPVWRIGRPLRRRRHARRGYGRVVRRDLYRQLPDAAHDGPSRCRTFSTDGWRQDDTGFDQGGRSRHVQHGVVGAADLSSRAGREDSGNDLRREQQRHLRRCRVCDSSVEQSGLLSCA